MADYQHKTNTGSSFINDKGDNPNRPDWKGTINVEGRLYTISTWKKQGSKGEWYSHQVEEKRDSPKTDAQRELVRRAAEESKAYEEALALDEVEGDLPF